MLAAVIGTADHVRRNRAVWDRLAAEYAEPGLRMWAEPEPTCGIWTVAETRAGVLPADLEGREFITAGVLDGRQIVAWSLWEGYLKMPSGAALQELLAEHQIRLTSVHASVFDLRRLVEALGPKRVVPIHSDAGDRFCEFFPRVERHVDGDWWQVGSK
jgi:hypothetical protein